MNEQRNFSCFKLQWCSTFAAYVKINLSWKTVSLLHMLQTQYIFNYCQIIDYWVFLLYGKKMVVKHFALLLFLTKQDVINAFNLASKNKFWYPMKCIIQPL